MREIVDADDDVDNGDGTRTTTNVAASASSSSSPLPSSSLLMVLIDTEGFDCSIILGIGTDSRYLPQFLLFEQTQCDKDQKRQTLAHLHSMGYQHKNERENILAWRPH
jgi:hypothetical protein